MSSKKLAVNTEKRRPGGGSFLMSSYHSGGGSREALVDDEAKEPNTPATPQTPQSLALLQSPSGGGAQVMAPGRDNRLSKFKTFQSYNNELGMRGASTQSWVRLALQAITEGDERALRRIFQQTDTNVNVRVLFFTRFHSRPQGFGYYYKDGRIKDQWVNEYMRKYEEEDSLLHLSVRNRASEAVVETLLQLGIEKDCVNAAGLTAAEVGQKFCECKRRYPALRGDEAAGCTVQ